MGISASGIDVNSVFQPSHPPLIINNSGPILGGRTVAGELEGVSEPALVLTPPAEGKEAEHGLRPASEVAHLKLNADWVILSACNTAAAHGTPGARGLSGLAKAFFYAGSRALLVSHWPVGSDAAVTLTTRMLAAAKTGLTRAEAHRQAMMAMIDSAPL